MKERFKKIFAAGCALLLCVALLAGCGGKKEDVPTDTGATNAADANGMQPGAKVEHSLDEQGNKVTQYTNPDGSGGGSVELD